MEFKEIKSPPEFTLTMTLHDAIDLWKIVSVSKKNGNEIAKKFVDALYEFAEHSNKYNEFL